MKEKRGETKEATSVSGHNDQIRWEPRVIQFNAGRLEVALPYPVVFLFVLAVIVVIMIAFKLGQLTSSGSPSRQNPKSDRKNAQPVGDARMNVAPRNRGAGQTKRNATMGQGRFDATVRPGNAIVIKEHRVLSDLVPVKRFFAENTVPDKTQ